MGGKSAVGVARRRVFIIDEHTLFREGLGCLIGDDHELVGGAGSMRDALPVIGDLLPEVLISEIHDGGNASNLDLLRKLRARHPSLRILVVSSCDEKLFAERALRAGASGYLMKTANARELNIALRAVEKGEIYVDAAMTSILIHKQAEGNRRSTEADGQHEISELSDREYDIFVMIGAGKRSKEIAADLGISVKTVENHRSHIAAKLPLEPGDRLLSFASRWVGANITESLTAGREAD